MSKKSFLNLILKDSNPTTEQSPQNNGTNVQQTTQPVSTLPNLTVQGVADNKFIEILEKVIESSNLPGQDYFEFKQAVQNMNGIISDEKTKFVTTFIVFKQQGCEKIKLIESADHYIEVIKNEKDKFNKELTVAFEKNVTTKLKQVDENKKKLEELAKQITEINTTNLQLSQEAQQAEMEIRTKEANFMASADIITSQIISDKEKINQYLQ